jgi:ATP-dependent Lon protease
MRKFVFIATLVIAIVAFCFSCAIAQTIQDPPGRPRQAKPAQKPVDPAEKAVNPAPTPEPEELMRRAISDLSLQIGLLTDEMKKLRRDTDRNAGMLELLLNEDRLSKLEDKIQKEMNNKAQLDAREQDINRRMKNIQGELAMRGILRRDEAEAAVRADLQRGLEDVHSQQTVSQQRIADLNEQSVKVRARLEALQKKFEPDLKEEK